MKATVNPVDQHVVTLTIEVPAAEVDKGIKQAVKRIAGQVNIPGFRKGHAPRRVLEMNFGKEAILEEAFEVLASQNYSAALRENDIVPVSEPEIEREQFEEPLLLVWRDGGQPSLRHYRHSARGGLSGDSGQPQQ